jgi:hypothetical protein
MPECDAIALVTPNLQTGYSVALTYSTAVPRALVSTQLNTLLKETGWRAYNINITDRGLSPSAKDAMTSLGFTTPQVVDLRNGYLQVLPFIKALKALKSIRLVYIVPPGFRFSGPVQYADRHVKITMAQSGNTFSYGITIKNPNFGTLNLPGVNQPTLSTTKHSNGPGWNCIAYVILLALGVGVLTFFVTGLQVKNNRSSKQ